MSGNSKKRDTVIVILLVLIVGGGVAAFGFFQDETTAFIRLRGWDLSPIDRGTKQFVESAAKGDGDGVMAVMGPESAEIMPKKKNGKLVSFMVPDYGGPVERTLKKLASSPTPKYGKPQLVTLDGGHVAQRIDFPDHALVLNWDLLPAGWRIVRIMWVPN